MFLWKKGWVQSHRALDLHLTHSQILSSTLDLPSCFLMFVGLRSCNLSHIWVEWNIHALSGLTLDSPGQCKTKYRVTKVASNCCLTTRHKNKRRKSENFNLDSYRIRPDFRHFASRYVELHQAAISSSRYTFILITKGPKYPRAGLFWLEVKK